MVEAWLTLVNSDTTDDKYDAGGDCNGGKNNRLFLRAGIVNILQCAVTNLYNNNMVIWYSFNFCPKRLCDWMNSFIIL